MTHRPCPTPAWFGLLAGAVALLGVAPSRTDAADWIHWRGPTQNGLAADKDLPEKWSPKEAGKDNLVWKQPYGCRSTPLVMNGKVYIINNAGQGIDEGERVMCFDEKTGQVLWEDRFNVWHTDIVSSRVGWTNLAADKETGNIYAHGTQGLLICYDGETGKHLWEHSLTEEYGRVTGYGGRVVSPLVDGDLVIVGMVQGSWGEFARGMNRFVAFDKKTGNVVWWSDPCSRMKGTYYSSAVVAVINGERQMIVGAADGCLHGIQILTGKPIWKFQVGANVVNSSPVVNGNLIYITHGEENFDSNVQGRVVCVDASQLAETTDVEGVKHLAPKIVWDFMERTLKAGYTTPILTEDKLYVCDDSAKLYCFDAKTGKELWKRPYNYGRLARGSGVFADGKIYICNVNAEFTIIRPEETTAKEVHSVRFRGTGPGFVETNGTPAIVNGRIFIGTRDELYCIGKPEVTAKAEPLAGVPELAKADPNGEPAQLALYPADVMLSPGGEQSFTIRTFDAKGNFLREVPSGEWSLPTPKPAPLPPTAPAGAKPLQPPALDGQVADGKLTVSAQKNGQQGHVLVKAAGLTARARVRVAPDLPYTQDFEKLPIGAPIPGSVNSQGKYAVTELKGQKVLRKLAENPAPPVARANAYLSKPSSTGYTIQADVMGEVRNKNRPDVGVVANRYTFMLGGNKQELRIVSWEALPRVNKTISFDWEPDTWYTLKLMVDVQDKQAIIKGKVWAKGASEPAEWTLEITDPSPNREGAPALYGYATGIIGGDRGAEAYYDNVAITLNGKTTASAK